MGQTATVRCPDGEHTCMLPGSHTPAPPGFCHIYKYIHKYITYNSGSGSRLPTEAQLTVTSQNSRKGHWAPRNVLHGFLLHKSPPSLFSGSSLSSTESCHRWVWRLETWAAWSWAGCADQSHSGCPGGGGAAAGSAAAGGQA